VIDPVNDPPILNETGSLEAYEDQWFDFAFGGYDPIEGDDVTFSINAVDIIPGLVDEGNFFFYPNGSFHLLPDNDMVGEYVLNLSIDDGNGGIVWMNVTLTIINVNDPPVLNETGLLDAHEDQWFNYTFTGYDPYEGDDVSFSINATDVIPGLIDGENFFFYPNGSFHLLPDNDMVGEYVLNLSIDDGNGGIAWMNVTLIIINVNDAPTGTINEPIGPLTIENGENVTFNATAIDIDGDDLEITWIMEGGIIDVTMGFGPELVYTFTTDGTYNITCYIDDGEEEIAIGTVMITVFTPIPDNTAPHDITVQTTPVVGGLDSDYASKVSSNWQSSGEIPTDAPITFTVTATDDEGDELTYTWTLIEDPNWQMTGNEITIQADTLEVGTYTFKVTVDDGNDHIIEETLDPISIVESYDTSDDPKEGGGMLIVIIIIVILILIVAAILIFFLVVKKKKPEEGGEETPTDIPEPGPPAEEAGQQTMEGSTAAVSEITVDEGQLAIPPDLEQQPTTPMEPVPSEQTPPETTPPVPEPPVPTEPTMQQMPEQPAAPPQPETPPVQQPPEQPVAEQPVAPPQPPTPEPPVEQQPATPQQSAQPQPPEE
jgi:heme/copper-type cytochrome/quinol oxidase subunit 2